MCHISRNRSLHFAHNWSFDFDCCNSTDEFTMDKFVTKKKIGDSNAPANSDSDSNRGQSSTSQKREEPKTVVRRFNLQWENDYFVTENKGKTLCLLCRHEFSDNKKYAIERHFTLKHSGEHTKFLDSTKREIEVARLKNELQGEKKVIRNFLDKNEVLTSASYQIAFNLAKSAKPYTDSEFYKDLLHSTISTLCTNFDEKVKVNLLDNVRLLPISGQTISRRVHDLGAHIEFELRNNLQKCHSFALALDETTDIADVSQLVFWVRYVIDMNTFGEELLALVPLNEKTRAIDIFNAFLSVMSRFNLNLKKLACICTDGAPAMTGKTNGFVVNVQKHMRQNGIQHDLVAYHCILHQENLCAKAIEKGNNVLAIVTEVHKLIFFFFLSSMHTSNGVSVFFLSDYQQDSFKFVTSSSVQAFNGRIGRKIQ